MPVQINEMVIKGAVGTPGEAGEKPAPKKQDAGMEKAIGKLSYSLRRQIVQECVQEVMDKINLSRER
jgi:hypothetical protein